MTTFTVPTAASVSPSNRAIFEQLEKNLGKVPNLYATFAHSNYLHALTGVPVDFPAAPAL
jgi:hypothetical protein